MTIVGLESLRQMGREAGFDAIGATSAADFPELEAHLQAYEKRGLTGFEESDIRSRISPRHWMASAKSLIAVAIAYLTPEAEQTARRHPREGIHGQTSVYVYGQDYHLVMRRKLEHLVELLEAHVGHAITAIPAIDTSPLVDRRVAERAGIGWIGKNCMFFTEQHGSFVFLGTLVVDIELEYAQQSQPAQCGTCQRCLDACPTNALIAPGVIDAKRCLSYVTQMKGMVPREFREPLGRRVWGCDTCQWACPESRGRDTQYASQEAFLPQGELAYPDLLAVLQLSNRAFQRRYGHTAAAWRGLATWKRNALLALGNAKAVQAVEHIIPFLRHERFELRASAAWALSKVRTDAGIVATQEAYSVETDDTVREEMVWAIGLQTYETHSPS